MFFRTLSILLVVGWQAAGGGMFGMLHQCRMAAEAHAEARECYCPHKKAQQQEQHTGATLKVDCCDAHELLDASPAVAVDTQRTNLLPALAVEPPSWSLAPADESALTELYLRDVHFAQGPPLFLKIRTLLI